MPAAGACGEQELALLLAGTATVRAASHERLLALSARADPKRLEALVAHLGMLALLGRRLEQLDPAHLDDGLCRRLHAHALHAQRQGVGQQLLTVQLLAALEQAGIRALPLKGPLLGERLHGDAGARISADVDLLLAAADLRGAARALAALDYRAESHAGAELPALHLRLVHPQGLPEVELHWRVHWYETRFSAELLAASAPGPEGWLVPRRDHELVALLLLYARDGFAGLRLACDLAAWWDRFGCELDVDGIERTVRAHPQIARAIATAATVARRLVGLPAERILSPATLARASPRAARLANWPLRGSAEQISADVSLVDWLLAPPGQLGTLARRNLLPTQRDLLARWPAADARPHRLALRRLLHAVRVLGRYALAAPRLLPRRAPIARGALDAR